MRLTLISLAFSTFALPALAAEFAPESGGHIEFRTPSNNICCVYTEDRGYDENLEPTGEPSLHCDRVAPKYWNVYLNANGKVKVNKHPGEVPGCGMLNVLDYGETWSEGPYTCKSRSDGLTCRVGGQGFKLNRKGIITYD